MPEPTTPLKPEKPGVPVTPKEQPKAPEKVDLKKGEGELAAKQQQEEAKMAEAQKAVEEKEAAKVAAQQKETMQAAQKGQAERTDKILETVGTAGAVKAEPQQVQGAKTPEQAPAAPEAAQPPIETPKKGIIDSFLGLFGGGKKEDGKNQEEEPHPESVKAVEGSSPEKLEEVAANPKSKEETPGQEVGQNPEQK